MSFEETLAAIVHAEMETVRAELRNLRERLESVDKRLPPALVTRAEAAERLGVSYSTVKRWVKDGTLPCRKVGNDICVDLAALHPLKEES